MAHGDQTHGDDLGQGLPSQRGRTTAATRGASIAERRDTAPRRKTTGASAVPIREHRQSAARSFRWTVGRPDLGNELMRFGVATDDPVVTRAGGMPRFPVKREGSAIVLVGNFNPSIFQPAWLGRHGLTSEEEADGAKIEIIRPEIAIFTVGGIRVHVQDDRFQVETAQPHLMLALRDLVLGAFRILEHTPVAKLGLNRHMHFQVPSIEDYNRVGHTLAPKKLWDELLEDPTTWGVIVQGGRPNSPAKYTRIHVGPSHQVQGAVYIHANEHFEAADSTNDFLDLIRAHWEDSQRFAHETAIGILERCLPQS